MPLEAVLTPSDRTIGPYLRGDQFGGSMDNTVLHVMTCTELDSNFTLITLRQ